MQRFGVQRATVRQATAQLVAEGLIYKIRGKGMFVKSVPAETRRVIDVPFMEAWSSRDSNRANWFNSRDFLRGIVAGIEAHRMYLRPHNIEPGPDFEKLFFDHFDPAASAGVIFFNPKGWERIIERLAGLRIHCVVAHAYRNDAAASAIISNHKESSCAAVRYLISRGHTRIAFMHGPLTKEASQEKYNGYERALLLHNLAPDPALLIECDGTPEDGRRAMQAFLGRAVGFTAVFAATDLRAFGAMQAIRERGLKIPADISIIGFDDMEEAQTQDPPLTTIRCERFEMGRQAVDLLIDLNRGVVASPAHRILPLKMVVRSSVADRNSTGRDAVTPAKSIRRTRPAAGRTFAKQAAIGKEKQICAQLG